MVLCPTPETRSGPPTAKWIRVGAQMSDFETLHAWRGRRDTCGIKESEFAPIEIDPRWRKQRLKMMWWVRFSPQ